MTFCLLSLRFGNNKSFYKATKLSGSAIMLSVRFGGVSDLLFNAMFHYRKRNIDKALAKVMLNQSDMIHSFGAFSYKESC